MNKQITLVDSVTGEEMETERLDPRQVSDNKFHQMMCQKEIEHYQKAATQIKSRWTDTLRKINVLDAACGTGYGVEYIGDCGNYIGLDISEQAVQKCRKRYPGFRYDIADLSKPGALDAFAPDVIVSFDTLEHLPDPDHFARESCKALKKSREKGGPGLFICSAPVVRTRDWSPYHLIDRNKKQWLESLTTAGFKVAFEEDEGFHCKIMDIVKNAPKGTGIGRNILMYNLTHPSYWPERFYWWIIKGTFRYDSMFAVLQA